LLPGPQIFRDALSIFKGFTYLRSKIEKILGMEIKGKIVNVLDEISGNGRNGTWRKREYILETEGSFPKKVCLTVWGDKIDQFGIQEGDQVVASIEIESREYNNRWYTDVKAWKVEKASGNAQTSPPQGGQPDVSTFNDESGEDTLPF
jgi:hypothetical protein